MSKRELESDIRNLESVLYFVRSVRLAHTMRHDTAKFCEKEIRRVRWGAQKYHWSHTIKLDGAIAALVNLVNHTIKLLRLL